MTIFSFFNGLEAFICDSKTRDVFLNSDFFFFFLSFFFRHPVHPPSGREAGDSWHGRWPVGWEQTSPWERGVQHAGGVSGSRERVSKMITL